MQLVVLFVSFFVCVYMCWSSWLIWCERCMCLSHSRSHTPRERDTNALSRWSGAVHMCRGILNLFSNKTLLYITFCFFCCYTAGSCSPSPSPFFYLFFLPSSSIGTLATNIGYIERMTLEHRKEKKSSVITSNNDTNRNINRKKCINNPANRENKRNWTNKTQHQQQQAYTPIG